MKKTLLLIFFLFISNPAYSQVYQLSSGHISTTWLLFISSFTPSEKLSIKTALMDKCTAQINQSQRFYCLFNSTSVVADNISWESKNFGFTSATSRAIINIDSAYDNIGQNFVDIGKAVRLRELWWQILSDKPSLKQCYEIIYQDYKINDNNTDWNIKVST